MCWNRDHSWKPYTAGQSAEIEKAFVAVRFHSSYYSYLLAWAPSPLIALTGATLLSQQCSSGSHTLTGGKWKIDFDKMRQYVVGTEHKYRAVRRLGAPDPSQGPEPEPEPGGEPAEMPTGL